MINGSLNSLHEHSRWTSSVFIGGTKKEIGVKFKGFFILASLENEWLIIIIFHARHGGLRRIYTLMKKDATCHRAVENFKHDRLLSFITLHLY
jgi:hypothetical protein